MFSPFLPFWNKENRSIRSGRRRRLAGHIGCRKDTSVHRELRINTETKGQTFTITGGSRETKPCVFCLLGDSRV